MKILALRGSNIASLTEFVVDFQVEPLRSAGIFAITGPTGSGKSSLLDAMCLALYQKAPRLDDLTGRETRMESRFGSIGQADIRNLLRRGCDTGHAECDFLAGDGHAYRARWGYRAAKRTGAAVQEEMSLVRLTDDKVLIQAAGGRKGEFKEAIESLVGLSYGQFTRTVLLAQGRFAEFLRSGEDERADLLEKLTGTAIYSRISSRIFERTASVRKERDELETARQSLAILTPSERVTREDELRELHNRLPILEVETLHLRQLLEGLERQSLRDQSLAALRLQSQALQPDLQASAVAITAAQVELEQSTANRQAAAEPLAQARLLDGQLETHQRLLQERTGHLETELEKRSALDLVGRELETRTGQLQQKIDGDRQWLEKSSAKLEPLSLDWPLWQERLRQADQLQGDRLLKAQQNDRTRLELNASIQEMERLHRELSATPQPGILTASSLHEELLALRQSIADAADLPAWLEVKAEITRTEAQQGWLEQRLAAVQGSLIASQASWETAKRLLESVVTALSGDVTALRSQLRPDTSCPVCGSLEHPWATAHPGLESVLEQHRAEEAQARSILDDLLAQRQDLLTQGTSAQETLRSSQARLTLLHPGPAWIQKASAQESPLEWARHELERIKQREESTLGQWKAVQEREALELRIQTHEATLQAQIRNLETSDEELSSAVQRLESCLASLDAPFGSQDWRTKWQENPDFTHQLTNSVTKFLERSRSLDTDLRSLEALTAQWSTHCQTVQAKDQDLATIRASIAAAQTELSSRQRLRDGLLGGRSVAAMEAHLESQFDAAHRRMDASRAKASQLEQQRSHLEGQIASQTQQHAQEAQALEELASRLLETTHPEQLRTAASERLVQRESILSELRTRTLRVEMDLEQDRTNRAQGEVLAKQLESRSAALEHWSQLNQEIGSADGKLFRRIAMQYTLEVLLEEANLQLRSIAPRYSLIRLGNSMHFGVSDHESYQEVRPVQTLSGGESFLVSLALALGLSHMAGGELSVESLFIDEGFGTLDGETLQGVMAALSGLHAQGRKVGLITHVEEMKEQIPAQVRVVKLGQGASRIEIVG